VLFGQPQRSFYASELIRDAGTGSGAAQRELARLEGRGLVVARRIGNQKHYQANAASPLFAELRSMVLKTVGLAELLRDALKPMTRDIRAAFVYGSVAKASDQAASDIDLNGRERQPELRRCLRSFGQGVAHSWPRRQLKGLQRGGVFKTSEERERISSRECSKDPRCG